VDGRMVPDPHQVPQKAQSPVQRFVVNVAHEDILNTDNKCLNSLFRWRLCKTWPPVSATTLTPTAASTCVASCSPSHRAEPRSLRVTRKLSSIQLPTWGFGPSPSRLATLPSAASHGCSPAASVGPRAQRF
jgi:hypothetical protein